MCRWCLGRVSVMCSDCVVMFWWYVGDALVLRWWCLCSVSVSQWWVAMLRWCFGDGIVMLTRWWILMNMFSLSVGSEAKRVAVRCVFVIGIVCWANFWLAKPQWSTGESGVAQHCKSKQWKNLGQKSKKSRRSERITMWKATVNTCAKFSGKPATLQTLPAFLQETLHWARGLSYTKGTKIMLSVGAAHRASLSPRSVEVGPEFMPWIRALHRHQNTYVHCTHQMPTA